MPRKSPGHDSRVITYRTLPGSSTRYQRVNVGECTAWVQTNLEFDLEVQHSDQTTETRPFIVDTFGQHHGSVEPTLYLTPGGKWIRRVDVAELSGLQLKPPLFIEITEPLATKGCQTPTVWVARHPPFGKGNSNCRQSLGEAVIFWVGVDLCIYFDDSKSLPSKGLRA